MYFSDLPLGFGLTLAENEVALNAFNGLAEEQKKVVEENRDYTKLFSVDKIELL